MTPTESIVLCEGYDDRSFLQGLLQEDGWDTHTDAYPPLDGRPVRGSGQYAYRRIDRWLRVVPMGGGGWVRHANGYVQEAATRSIGRIVIILDDDSKEVGSDSAPIRQSFEAWARGVGAVGLADGDWKLGDTIVSLVVWAANDPSEHLPQKQTLERLVSAAIADVYPARALHVSQWLGGRKDAPANEKHHKAHAASHMAGWFSEHGSQDFYRAIWKDEQIKPALESRLAAIGATRVFDALSA